MSDLLKRFYTIYEVMEILGVSRSTIERWVRGGKFPKPATVSSRVKFFKPSVESWIREHSGS